MCGEQMDAGAKFWDGNPLKLVVITDPPAAVLTERKSTTTSVHPAAALVASTAAQPTWDDQSSPNQLWTISLSVRANNESDCW